MKHWHQQKNDLSDRSVCVFLTEVMVRRPLNFMFGRVFTQPRCKTDLERQWSVLQEGLPYVVFLSAHRAYGQAG
jgi:hypothetical protein